MTPSSPASPSPCVRWSIYVGERNRLRRPGLVRSTDELVLLAVMPAETARRLTVELYRGDQLRDRRDCAPECVDGEAVLAVRWGRSATLTASSRLRCRLLLDDRVLGEQTVLLGGPAVDAQGRLADTPTVAPSEATRLACVRLLEETWRRSDG